MALAQCRKHSTLARKCFPHQPADAVAPDGRKVPGRDRKAGTQGYTGRRLDRVETLKEIPVDATAGRKHTIECSAAAKRCVLPHLSFVTDSQLVTSLCPATGQYVPPFLGGHPCTKTMSVTALSSVRLKRTFHQSFLLQCFTPS